MKHRRGLLGGLGARNYDYAPDDGKNFSRSTRRRPTFQRASACQPCHVLHWPGRGPIQADARIQRLHPMGFDDNGLPTERFVEQTYNVNKSNTRVRSSANSAWKRLKGAKTYEMWRNLGLSVDWSLRYSTIDPLPTNVAEVVH